MRAFQGLCHNVGSGSVILQVQILSGVQKEKLAIIASFSFFCVHQTLALFDPIPNGTFRTTKPAPSAGFKFLRAVRDSNHNETHPFA